MMDGLYQGLSEEIVNRSNSPYSKGVMGLGRKMLGVDDDKNRRILYSYNQLKYMETILHAKLKTFHEQYMEDAEKRIDNECNRLSKAADDQVDRMSEELKKRINPVIDQLQSIFDIQLSADYMHDFTDGSSGKNGFGDFSLGNYYWYIGYYKQWVYSDDIQEYTLPTFMEKFSEAYKEQEDAYLKLEDIVDCDQKYQLSSTNKLSIPIGVNEYGEIQAIEMGDEVANGTSHYGLIVGPTGSGKSSLLHTIIMSSIINYSPDELELYLLDFKQGNEFKIYENKRIPHLKCLGLDVMQEFGENVLNELWRILEKRNEMFAQASENGRDIKNISDYRKAGYKMPRILVIMDEFQVLFNTSQNKRVAYNAAALFSDFVSRARVYGIHFLLATQTLRKIYESSALTKGTLEEMHIRIALQCLESELISLIGDENAKKCIRKVEKKRGAGIYLENDIVSEPVAMQVAYVETEIQNRMLDEISKEYQEDFNNQETNMFVFRGNDSPGLKMKDIDHCDDKVFLLGEKIGMGDPVSVEIGIRRKTDMLVVGENVEAVNNATRLWIAQTMKKTARSSYNNIYVFDGSLMIDETAIVNETLSAEYSSPMVVVDNVFSVLHTIDLLYDEYISRKRRMMQGNKTDSDKENIYVVISNYQWIERKNVVERGCEKMIKVLDERICGTPVFCGSDFSLDVFAQNIIGLAQNNGINLTVSKDQCKKKGLLGKVYPCITIYNTMHMKDYYGYAFALDNNGNGCYLTQYMIGDSANWRKQVTTQQMGVIGKALLGPKNQKEEEAFYDVLKEIFQEAFNQC